MTEQAKTLTLQERECKALDNITAYYRHSLSALAVADGWDMEQDLVDFLDTKLELSEVIASSMHSGSSFNLQWSDIRMLLMIDDGEFDSQEAAPSAEDDLDFNELDGDDGICPEDQESNGPFEGDPEADFDDGLEDDDVLDELDLDDLKFEENETEVEFDDDLRESQSAEAQVSLGRTSENESHWVEPPLDIDSMLENATAYEDTVEDTYLDANDPTQLRGETKHLQMIDEASHIGDKLDGTD